jgi:antitoxin (DNA-binding transcriptional repressor) of toxin-antitoxin stability system
MSNMKTTTIREVQHNLSKILRWVEDGEVVVITRHKRAVANLVRAVPKGGAIQWPDFTARTKAIWGGIQGGKPASRIIIDERNGRP